MAAHTGLQPEVADTGVTVTVPDERHYRYDEARPRQLRGVRLDRSGQLSAWWTLPRDTMGGILNQTDLVEAFTEYLRWMVRLPGRFETDLQRCLRETPRMRQFRMLPERSVDRPRHR